MTRMRAPRQKTFYVSAHPNYDQIARVIQRLTKARAAFLTVFNRREMVVVGKDGVPWSNLPASWCWQSDIFKNCEMRFFPNIELDARLSKHPIAAAIPTLRRLLFIPVELSGQGTEACMVVLDPARRWPFDPDLAAVLTQLAALAGQLIDQSETIHSTADRKHQSSAITSLGFEEESIDDNSDPVCDFLFETLRKRTVLRTRGDVAYTTVRTWRSSIKKSQIAALAACKRRPKPYLIERMSEELAIAARALLGENNINAVVHVPCGHSTTPFCFSELVAGAVAQRLGVEPIGAFARQHRPGKSHPRRNAGLAPFKLQVPVSGSILVVDDVVTSGLHMERAISGLRAHTKHVLGLAWIGDG